MKNTKTRQEYIKEYKKRLDEIDAIWKKRDITDATAEEEWDEYENILMILAENNVTPEELK